MTGHAPLALAQLQAVGTRQTADVEFPSETPRDLGQIIQPASTMLSQRALGQHDTHGGADVGLTSLTEAIAWAGRRIAADLIGSTPPPLPGLGLPTSDVVNDAVQEAAG